MWMKCYKEAILMIAIIATLAISSLAYIDPIAGAAHQQPEGTENTWLYIVAGVLLSQFVVPFVMRVLKKWFPKWNKKAWAPPLIGAMTTLMSAMVAGTVTGWREMIVAFATGYAAGATASSHRDIFKGK
jgi:uncharacterized BrkB/YihY/UPF0761 family membrane protein